MNFEHLEKSTSVETSSGVTKYQSDEKASTFAKSQFDEISSATAESQTKPERSTPFQKDFPFTVLISISQILGLSIYYNKIYEKFCNPKKESPQNGLLLYLLFIIMCVRAFLTALLLFFIFSYFDLIPETKIDMQPYHDNDSADFWTDRSNISFRP